MNNPFDFNNNSFIFPTTGNTGIDTSGNMHIRMGDHMSVDTSTGEAHINSGWKAEDDDDEDMLYLLGLFK